MSTALVVQPTYRPLEAEPRHDGLPRTSRDGVYVRFGLMCVVIWGLRTPDTGRELGQVVSRALRTLVCTLRALLCVDVFGRHAPRLPRRHARALDNNTRARRCVPRAPHQVGRAPPL